MRSGRLLGALACALALTACGSAVPPDAVPSRPASSTAPATPAAQPVPTTAVDAGSLAEQVEAAGLPPSLDPAATEWTAQVPSRTRQVIRTISTQRWCRQVHCTLTQAWERRTGGWTKVREFRSSIGPKGWGKRRMNDGRTPEGVFRIKVTFSTAARNPGQMPWRRRLPTSNVTDELGPTYNTWLEEPGRTNGDRPSMRWGFVVDYNNVRLTPGVGPAPVQGKGSGIFYHTSQPGKRWSPSEGCTQVGNPRNMRWLLAWLRPGADPRVVQNR